MNSKTISILIAAVLMVASLSGCSAIARQHRSLFAGHRSHNSDPLTGEWRVSFFVHDSITPGTFTLKLDGNKISGSAYSDHTGPGIVRDGKWEDGKLSFTLDFKKHESIAIDGKVRDDGTIAGEFHTEGFTDKWEASKK